MKKHIYLHTSNLECTIELRNDPEFTIVPQCPSWEMNHTQRNEYGRIETGSVFYHVLVGDMRQSGCPWCGSEAKIKKLRESSLIDFASYCMQCVKCGARGPSLNVHPHMEENKESMSNVECMLDTRFKTRRPWDDGFVNPYE